MSRTLSSDEMAGMLTALKEMAEVVREYGEVEDADVETFAEALDTDREESMPELRKWADLLVKVKADPSQRNQDRVRRALVMRGVPESNAFLAVVKAAEAGSPGNAAGGAGGAGAGTQGSSSGNPGGGSRSSLVCSPGRVDFGEMKRGEGSTKEIQVQGGPWVAQVEHGSVSIRPDRGSSGTTRVLVSLRSLESDAIMDRIEFSGGGGILRVPVVAAMEVDAYEEAPQVPPLVSLVKVEGGSFRMGSDSSDQDDEKPVHSVQVSSFYMGKYPVTQGQYRKLVGANPSEFAHGPEADKRPVECVTWYDAVEFCNRMSEREGLASVYRITKRNPGSGYPVESAEVVADFTKNGYRLPTEAEWEYAARGGKLSKGYEYAGSDDLDEVAWYEDNSGDTTHPVGRKQGNELELFDMSGNVWEWCQDWFDSGYYGVSTNRDPMGASSGSLRVNRGGGWCFDAGLCRVSYRSCNGPDSRGDHLGFRVVRRAP